jgi:hypothetical protein
MYLFTRTLHLAGPQRDIFGWAADMTAFVNENSANRTTLWVANFGMPFGQVVWSAWLPSMADVSTMFAGLSASDDYQALIARGRDYFTGPASDELRQLVHGTPPDTPLPIGAVTNRTTATIANGQYGPALAWGAETAALVQRVSGSMTFFLMDTFGTFGQVTWFTTSRDMAAAEAANDKVNSDAEYLGRLADVATLFLPGSGHRALATKLA